MVCGKVRSRRGEVADMIGQGMGVRKTNGYLGQEAMNYEELLPTR